MKVNNVNYGVQMGHQANLNRKKSPKTQSLLSNSPSFGMKMNNQHITQKDKVSFGMFTLGYLFASKMVADEIHKNKDAFVEYATKTGIIPDSEAEVLIEALDQAEHEIRKPYRIAENVTEDLDNMPKQAMNEAKKAVKEMKGQGFNGVVKGVSKIVGAPVSAITTTCHEVKKDLQDRPSSPREKKARIVVDTYTAASGATGAAAGFVPIVPIEEVLQIAPEQREAMIEEIADIYNLDNSDKYILGKRLGIKWHNKLEPKIIEGTIMGFELSIDYLKENATEMLQESITELSDVVPYLKPTVKGVTKTVNAKILGEKAIQECKRLAKRH